MSEERKNNAYVDNIGAVASGGVGDSVGAEVIFLYSYTYFEFDSPSPPMRNYQNNEMLIIIVINPTFF